MERLTNVANSDGLGSYLHVSHVPCNEIVVDGLYKLSWLLTSANLQRNIGLNSKAETLPLAIRRDANRSAAELRF